MIVAIALALLALFIFRKDKSIGFFDFYKKLWKRIVKGLTESIKEAEFPAEENEIDEDDKREEKRKRKIVKREKGAYHRSFVCMS